MPFPHCYTHSHTYAKNPHFDNQTHTSHFLSILGEEIISRRRTPPRKSLRKMAFEFSHHIYYTDFGGGENPVNICQEYDKMEQIRYCLLRKSFQRNFDCFSFIIFEICCKSLMLFKKLLIALILHSGIINYILINKSQTS